MKRSGFTLIELSIVLIIIGLIIGGVIKGKDLIRGSEQKKTFNTWVKGWQIAVSTYQDRTGNVLADGEMNGGTEDEDPDGEMDDIDLDDTTTVQDRLKEVGIDVPTSNIAGTNGGGYRIKGKYITENATAGLYYLSSATDGTDKNKLYIKNVPTDVAIAWDTIVDGEMNPSKGAFRRHADDQTGTDGTANTWPDASDTTTVNVSLEL